MGCDRLTWTLTGSGCLKVPMDGDAGDDMDRADSGVGAS